MVYNGILMETIGIYVMVSIGLLLFFKQGYYSKIVVSMYFGVLTTICITTVLLQISYKTMVNLWLPWFHCNSTHSHYK